MKYLILSVLMHYLSPNIALSTDEVVFHPHRHQGHQALCTVQYVHQSVNEDFSDDNSTTTASTIMSARCNNGAYPTESHSLYSLTLCNWPGSSFDLQLLRDYKQLQNFSLTNSNVTHLEGEFPNGLNSLQHIQLTDLNISSFDLNIFRKLRTIKIIDLRKNQIKHIQKEMFEDLFDLEQIFLSDNPWDCTNNLTWMLHDKRITDKDDIMCVGNEERMFPGKPMVPIMQMLQNLQNECPARCTCDMSNAVWGPNKKVLVPVINVNCSYLGLTQLPEVLPSNTTTLKVIGNKISSVDTLISNNHYFGVSDIYLDDNNIDSIANLEGARWLSNFRVFSLRGNKLSEIPVYAVDNALERNRNAIRFYLGNNPWICDCYFTPTFQEFLLKYQKIISDTENISCNTESTEEKIQILELTRSAVCQSSDQVIEILDLINCVLASLIILILGKLAYDYYSFKKTGKLPWIVRKMP